MMTEEVLMEKRTFRDTGKQISLLGFGGMRFPVISEENKKIDRVKAQEMIDYAYAQGVNYFDTAYMYHDGESELFFKEALKKYPRDSYYLADKLPIWMGIDSLEDAKARFAEQLDKCGVDYFDFYLLHNLSSREVFEEKYLGLGILDYLISEKEAGRIKHLGFSFHGDVPLFDYLMKLRKWDFFQMQLNYLDWDDQRARDVYEIGEAAECPCIVMEPVRGGSLVKLCDSAVKLLKDHAPDKSVASWAIRYAASKENVLTVLSGMTTMDHVIDNCETLGDFKPLEEKDYEVLSAAIAEYRKNDTIPCTGCRYCSDCKAGIDIAGVFALYNEFVTSGRMPFSLDGTIDEEYKAKAAEFVKELEKFDPMPDKCIRCKACEDHCPQSIKISRMLGKISGMAKRFKEIL